MGIKVGGIDLTESALNSELRIGVLERIVDMLIQRPGYPIIQRDIDRIRAEALAELQSRYPDADIQLK